MADGDLIFSASLVDDMPWRLVDPQSTPMFQSGETQVTIMDEAFWTFELATPWMDKSDYHSIVDPWIIDRKGAKSTFTAFRMSHQNAHVPVSTDVGLTVTATDRAASTVSFGGTGVWTATKGDMVSFYTAKGGYWIGAVMETKAAVAGAMTALKVWPPPFPKHAKLANPRRIRALGEFRLDIPVPKPIERVDERRVNFAATQVIRG